jgi:hypothetical protein
MKKNIVITIIVVIVVGGLAFWGGMYYGQTTAKTAQSAAAGQFRQRTGNNFARGGGFSSGSIIAKDATSITLQLASGGSEIVLYSGSTQIGQFVQATPGDLQIGQTVTVMGQTNSDGSLTANNIQIRPLSATGTADRTNP